MLAKIPLNGLEKKEIALITLVVPLQQHLLPSMESLLLVHAMQEGGKMSKLPSSTLNTWNIKNGP